MKKYLLPENGCFYKANLHCHSTCSDGDFTPEELKRMYKEKGYSIIAYTDHRNLILHNDLTDDGFLALNGYELDLSAPFGPDGKPGKVCHLCLVSLTAENEPIQSDLDWIYCPEHINEIVRRGKEAGFFATYNHPVWSVEDYSDYTQYRGFDAMEICNWGCCRVGFQEYSPMVYDDMLRAGGKLYCVATDDNHVLEHCFGGFTMLKAEKLDYPSIAKALQNGDFYASQGPEIKELWYEDGEFHITCSPAKTIEFTADYRWAYSFSNPDGSPIEYAHVKLPEYGVYIRSTVTDFEGKHANTNAYYLDEIKD